MALTVTSINTPSYASSYGHLSQHLQESDALKFLDNVLQPQYGDRALDFGCGTGNVTLDLARRIGSDGFLVGVDPDDDRIRIAQNRLQSYDNVKIIRGSISEATAFAPYDIINANHVIHWIPRGEHEEYLRKIFASLKPGGRFGFTTVHSLKGFIRDLSASQYENSYDSFLSAIGWSFSSLAYWETLLKKTGFEISYGSEEERVSGVFPDERAFLEWWEATCVGHFSAAQMAPEALMTKYDLKRNEPIPIHARHVDVVAKKPKKPNKGVRTFKADTLVE
ncbi:demethylmenaquinone methyltransferase-like [Oscarella lobularis]|uniref:demethylmenaquinone methyltransferase-like n=1 Tax=Oscarella lobularis TaxID=121494 RepID=UPI0033142071